ncbi:MAG: IS110 family transposase [Acidimicrobiales bacterium]
MATIAQLGPGQIVGGVDTHKHVHVAAVLSHIGRVLDLESFPATRAGYRQLLRWLHGHGEVVAVGVQGCGSWGAGLARHLTAEGVTVVEVNRPNRQNRRRRGKSDPVDAEAAGRAVLNGDATVTPKTADGPVEALRQLRVARTGAMKARTAAANQLHSLSDTAPELIRAQLRPLTFKQKIAAAERWRPRQGHSVEAASKQALASVARRWRVLDAEAKALQAQIQAILNELAPRMLAHHGVGYETASQLLVAAGDNPDRLGHERSFAALCGSSPVAASSGKTNRHRLNRGGDRQANSALWTIVRVRMVSHSPTKAYIQRRTADGLSKREIMRCLKRYLARELFPDIQAIIKPQHTP